MWDCENPNLYTVKTVLKSLDQEIDAYETRIGFRTIEFTANDGFYLNGKKVCEDKRITAGKPVAFKFTLENEVKPNGQDIALFTCECVDEKGNVVPTANELVNFTVSTEDGLISKETGEFVKVDTGARAVIVGTGSDNTDHNNVKNNTRQMYMGKISVAVKPGLNQKKLILNAQSSNIGFGKIVVEF